MNLILTLLKIISLGLTISSKKSDFKEFCQNKRSIDSIYNNNKKRKAFVFYVQMGFFFFEVIECYKNWYIFTNISGKFEKITISWLNHNILYIFSRLFSFWKSQYKYPRMHTYLFWEKFQLIFISDTAVTHFKFMEIWQI